jgi:HSP20 family protein
MSKSAKNRPGQERPDDANPGDHATGFDFHLGGFLGKLGTMVEKLSDLAQKGESFSQTGSLKGLDPEGKLRGVYGFSIKTGLGQQGEQEVHIEPFGNIRRGSAGDAVVDEVREPLVDVYEEDDHVLVLAEIPGVSRKDVQIELAADRLTIRARRGQQRYEKEVPLPASFPQEAMHWECTNGILKIRLER